MNAKMALFMHLSFSRVAFELFMLISFNTSYHVLLVKINRNICMVTFKGHFQNLTLFLSYI